MAWPPSKGCVSCSGALGAGAPASAPVWCSPARRSGRARRRWPAPRTGPCAAACCQAVCAGGPVGRLRRRTAPGRRREAVVAGDGGHDGDDGDLGQQQPAIGGRPKSPPTPPSVRPERLAPAAVSRTSDTNAAAEKRRTTVTVARQRGVGRRNPRPAGAGGAVGHRGPARQHGRRRPAGPGRSAPDACVTVATAAAAVSWRAVDAAGTARAVGGAPAAPGASTGQADQPAEPHRGGDEVHGVGGHREPAPAGSLHGVAPQHERHGRQQDAGDGASPRALALPGGIRSARRGTGRGRRGRRAFCAPRPWRRHAPRFAASNSEPRPAPVACAVWATSTTTIPAHGRASAADRTRRASARRSLDAAVVEEGEEEHDSGGGQRARCTRGTGRPWLSASMPVSVTSSAC